MSPTPSATATREEFQWSTARIEHDLTIEIAFEVDEGTIEVLRSQLADAVALRPRRLVVDLSSCPSLCGEGSGVLEETRLLCDAAEIEFELLGCPPS